MSALPPLLLRGDCLHELKLIPDASVDAVVTDPPYGLGFMGQKWDTYANETGRRSPGRHTFDHVGGNHNPSNAVDQARTRRVEDQKFQAWCELWATECLRILKPGGHMLAFGGTRTWHRLTSGVEDAGFEIRDSIAWLYGSGFPKSMDVSKAIDKAAGAEREVVGPNPNHRPVSGVGYEGTYAGGNTGAKNITVPTTDAAREWEGWGTALKPAFEPVVVARKPFRGTVVANVLAHGTGALNIDATRIGVSDAAYARNHSGDRGHAGTRGEDRSTDIHAGGGSASNLGRWPANVVLDESQAVVLDEQAPKTGASTIARAPKTYAVNRDVFGESADVAPFGHDERGGASRFFYVAKAPKSERPVVDGTAHPTVKPLALMRWLLRLVTPPRGVIVDPFAGSGTTLEAAYLEDFDAIGVEMTPDYWPLIEARIARVTS